MSDTDYTKKAKNGNSADHSAKQRRSLRIWAYEFACLYKGRADKFALSAALAVLCIACVEIAYLGAVFQDPADIILCQPGQGSEGVSGHTQTLPNACK